MEINKENQNKKRLGRGIGSLLGGADGSAFNDPAPNQPPVPVATKATGNSASTQNNPTDTIGRPVRSDSTNQSLNTQNKSQLVSAPTVASAEPVGDRVWNIAIDKLVPGVYQPRRHFNKESLQELANSIKVNGVIQPISVRKRKEGGFEILAGERRWRAAQMANLHEIPAIIKTLSDREALQLALIENIQREDLDPIEEAESYQRLIEEFSLSQQEAAEKVGKERSSVANALRLLSLPIEVKDLLSVKSISVGHAKVLLSVLDRKTQIELAKKVQNLQLSVRALEQEIKKNSKQDNESAAVSIDNHKENLATKLAKELADQLQKSLGTKVEIPYNKGKGQIVLHYYSDDQLTSLYEKLKTN